MFEAHQSGLVGKTTGAIEAAGGVAFAAGQQTQTDALRLFRVGAALELPAHPRAHIRSPSPWPSAAGARGTTSVVPDGVWACGPGVW